MKLIEIRLMKEIANALTPYFSPGNTLTLYFTNNLVKPLEMNYVIEESDVEKALIGFSIICGYELRRWDIGAGGTMGFPISNLAWESCRESRNEIDFFFRPPKDDINFGPQYLRFTVKDYHLESVYVVKTLNYYYEINRTEESKTPS